MFEILHEENNNEEEFEKSSTIGRPKKSANLIEQRQLNRRLRNIYETIVKECETSKVDLDTLLSFVGRKFHLTQGENYDRSKGLMYSKIFNKIDPFAPNRLNAEQGAYLQESLELGKQKTQSLKTFLGRIHFLEKSFLSFEILPKSNRF